VSRETVELEEGRRRLPEGCTFVLFQLKIPFLKDFKYIFHD
jgi:hypothetical protein